MAQPNFYPQNSSLSPFPHGLAPDALPATGPSDDEQTATVIPLTTAVSAETTPTYEAWRNMVTLGLTRCITTHRLVTRVEAGLYGRKSYDEASSATTHPGVYEDFPCLSPQNIKRVQQADELFLEIVKGGTQMDLRSSPINPNSQDWQSQVAANAAAFGVVNKYALQALLAKHNLRVYAAGHFMRNLPLFQYGGVAGLNQAQLAAYGLSSQDIIDFQALDNTGRQLDTTPPLYLTKLAADILGNHRSLLVKPGVLRNRLPNSGQTDQRTAQEITRIIGAVNAYLQRSYPDYIPPYTHRLARVVIECDFANRLSEVAKVSTAVREARKNRILSAAEGMTVSKLPKSIQPIFERFIT